MAKKTKTTEPAETANDRLAQALEYLKQHDVDIYSRTDGHYLTAIKMAAGVCDDEKPCS